MQPTKKSIVQDNSGILVYTEDSFSDEQTKIRLSFTLISLKTLKDGADTSCAERAFRGFIELTVKAETQSDVLACGFKNTEG